jgi:hypothetical protein
LHPEQYRKPQGFTGFVHTTCHHPRHHIRAAEMACEVVRVVRSVRESYAIATRVDVGPVVEQVAPIGALNICS